MVEYQCLSLSYSLPWYQNLLKTVLAQWIHCIWEDFFYANPSSLCSATLPITFIATARLGQTLIYTFVQVLIGKSLMHPPSHMSFLNVDLPPLLMCRSMCSGDCLLATHCCVCLVHPKHNLMIVAPLNFV